MLQQNGNASTATGKASTLVTCGQNEFQMQFFDRKEGKLQADQIVWSLVIGRALRPALASSAREYGVHIVDHSALPKPQLLFPLL
jgi:hypothetical protein